MSHAPTRKRARWIALCLAVGLALSQTACERVTLRGEGGSSSDSEIDIGVRF